MFVVAHKKIFFIISAVLVSLSVFAVILFGLNFGIDFTGGALTEVSYPHERPDKVVLENKLSGLDMGGFSLRPSGEDSYILRTRDLTEEARLAVNKTLSLDESVVMNVDRFNSIGPVIGTELRNKAYLAITVVVLAIILFIAFAFRHVSKPISSWKYGLIAIVALLHDIIVPIGVFAVLGKFFGAEVDILFVMALLAILGYSVNDTIVVFDRVRENLRDNEERNMREDFELTIGKSLNQTYVRSVNTSLTTMFVLLTLFVIGAAATQYFALTLLVGVLAGTYSSIFLATPLLVAVCEKQAQSKKKGSK
jgi:preprotein translocase subunit SecF